MSECVLQPVNDRIVIRKAGKREKTAGGIFLPENSQDKNVLQGEVLKVGPGAFTVEGRRLPMPVKEGDIIIYSGYAGQEVDMDDDAFHLISANDVLCTVK